MEAETRFAVACCSLLGMLREAQLQSAATWLLQYCQHCQCCVRKPQSAPNREVAAAGPLAPKML